MSPAAVGFIGIGILLLLLMLRMPVAFTLFAVGFAGFWYLSDLTIAFNFLTRNIFYAFSYYPMSVVLAFVLMGSFAHASGISERLYRAAYKWVGQFRGGLTLATVAACAGFAAICGSTTATAATMGKIALPEMKKYNYDDALATGCVAASGTLGILIPPSTIFIIYGLLTEVSIGKLFIAGVLPGLLLALLFMLTVVLVVRRNPALGPPGVSTGWKEKLRGTTGIIEAVILFIGVIGGLFLGFFTPTQAGAIGAAGALVIGLARRALSWRRFWESSKDAMRTSCMIMFIYAGAIVFGRFMSVTRIPFILGDWIETLSVAPMVVMAVIIVFYFIGGFFMEVLTLIILTVSIFYPIVVGLGFDPIWFGVIIVLVGEMGTITPPVGVNVFVIKGVAPDIPIETIFKGILPFVGALIVCTIILVIFPQIATFLPGLIRY